MRGGEHSRCQHPHHKCLAMPRASLPQGQLQMGIVRCQLFRPRATLCTKSSCAITWLTGRYDRAGRYTSGATQEANKYAFFCISKGSVAKVRALDIIFWQWAVHRAPLAQCSQLYPQVLYMGLQCNPCHLQRYYCLRVTTFYHLHRS